MESLLFRRFIPQHVRGFLFTRHRREDLPSFGLQAFEVFIHLGKDDIHVVVVFPRAFRPDAVSLFEDKNSHLALTV